MKISILTPYYSTKTWGGERALFNLIKNLPPNVHITLFTNDSSLNYSLKKIYVHAPNLLSWIIKSLTLPFILKFRKQHDVIFVYNHYFTNLIPGYLISRVLKSKLVVAVYHLEKFQAKESLKKRFKILRRFYGFDLFNSLKFLIIWPLVRRLLMSTDLIITSSQATAEDLEKIGISSSRIDVIHLGLEHEKPDVTKGREKVYDGIYLGRISPHKGAYDVVDIWKWVVDRRSDAKLAIIGGGDEGHINRMKWLIERYKLEKNIKFFGYLSDYKLSEVLFESKILVLPTHIEGFCFTIGKALLHGLPVICWDLPTLREIYGSFPSVKFVKENERHTFASEVIKELDNFNSKSFLSRKAILQKYSWRFTVNKFISAIKCRCLESLNK